MNPQPEATRQTQTSETGLVRGLTRWQALAIVVGGVLGTGVYIRPASIAQFVRAPASIIAVWTLTGLLSLAGALTYAELASRIPRSGGEYAFLRVTLGELPAFLFGWMRLTVGIGTVAALSVAVTVFLSDLIPLSAAWWSLTIPWRGQPLAIDFGPRQLIAVLVIAGLAILNIRGVGKAGRFQTWVTSVKVLGLLSLIGAVALFGQPASMSTVQDLDPHSTGPSAFSAAVLAAVAAYNGWANVAMVGGEVQAPTRTLPWALVMGILTVIGLYVALNVAYLHVLPMQEILTANSTAYPAAPSVASRAAVAALGPRVGMLLPLLFMVSALGTLHCNMLSVPRVFFAMARDGLFPRSLGSVSAVTHTPVVAIASFASVGAALALIGNYDRLTNMAAFGYLLFYALNAIGLLWWGRGKRAPDPHVQAVHRAIPALFLVGTLWLLVTVIVRGSVEVVAALALMAAGLPVFVLLRSRRAAEARP